MTRFWFWLLILIYLIWGFTLGCAFIYSAPAPFERHPETDPNEISPGTYGLVYAGLTEAEIKFYSDGTYKHFLIYPEPVGDRIEIPLQTFKYYTGKWIWNKETRIFVMNDLTLNGKKQNMSYIFKMQPDKLDSLSSYVSISLRRKP